MFSFKDDTSERGAYDCKYPHCDSNVLHAPNTCEFCDYYPKRQQNRVAKKINFTGERDPNKAICPSERARPYSVINRWGGNMPYKDGNYVENEKPFGWANGSKTLIEDLPESGFADSF